MPNILRILRSITPGNRPSGKQYGEPYVNFGDNQLGVFDSSNVARDLLGLPIFSASASYVAGQGVSYQGKPYIALGAVSPGAFTPAQWTLLAPLASPAFTGNPTAPTPSVGDNDTSVATTAFVQAARAQPSPNTKGAFRCTVQGSIPGFGAASWQYVTFNHADINQGGYYSTSGVGAWGPPAGLCYLHCQLFIQDAAAGGGLNIAVARNGTIIRQSYSFADAGGNGVLNISFLEASIGGGGYQVQFNPAAAPGGTVALGMSWFEGFIL
jgi:hypothetical protein